MEAFRARQFAKAGAMPNTFIGGIAKQGGTGVNAPIDTPYKLSQKLDIAVNRITGFKVIGDDVQCRIRGDYDLNTYVFGQVSTANANQNITYFHDLDGRVKYSGFRCFSYCQNLTSVIMNGYIGRGIEETNRGLFDNCTSLIECELNSLAIINGYYWFLGTKIENLNLNNLEYIANPAGAILNNFQNMTQLNILSARKLKQIGPDASINYANFQGIKLNATIEVHIDLATANSGAVDADLLYAKNTRNAIVEFYDDNGDYVSTL